MNNEVSRTDGRDAQSGEDGCEPLQAAAQDLVDAIAAEPVPERLRELALALGRARQENRPERARELAVKLRAQKAARNRNEG